MSDNTDKRTATQRIEDLEKVVTSFYQALTNLNQVMVSVRTDMDSLMTIQNDIALIKEATRILNNKSDAIIQVAKPETGISLESVSKLVIDMNVENLKNQVDNFLNNGLIVASEEVTSKGFVVVEELNLDGTVNNARVQFRMDSQNETTKTALQGKKVGDLVDFGENTYRVKILEVYSLVDKTAPTASVETAPESATVSSESPAAEATSETSVPLDSLPHENPVPEFVPSDESTLMKA